MSELPALFFAAVGDVHGHMHAMVRQLAAWEREHGARLEFVLQVGDFEPHRNGADLATMAAPAKYRKIGDFPDFYQGKAAFPWPVYFIGGNHEPYGFLDLLPSGGEITKGCYYLGRVGQASLAGLKVAGLSGIHLADAFESPRPGVNEFAERSNKAYIHFTAAEVEQVLDYGAADIFLLHEWPSGLMAAPVGNEYARLLVEALAPQLVLCGHMHQRASYTLPLPNGASAEVCCLANVEQGGDSFAVFRVENGKITREVHGAGKS